MLLLKNQLPVDQLRVYNRRRSPQPYLLCCIVRGVVKDILMFDVPFEVPWSHNLGDYNDGGGDVLCLHRLVVIGTVL